MVQPGVNWTSPVGFPHSDISGSTSARDSPELFAACHVLHRLLAPRHPPRALCSLTPSASDQAVMSRGAVGISDNTAKSKILTSISTDHISSWKGAIHVCGSQGRCLGSQRVGWSVTSRSRARISDRMGLAARRDGGDEETRTPDPLLAKEMLYQLSYVPELRQRSGGRFWTRTRDLCLIRAVL